MSGEHNRAARAGQAQRKRRAESPPRDEQIKQVFNLPCRICWSDGSTSESPIGQVFYDDTAYDRYKGYRQSGKPYPVRLEAIEPEDKTKPSTIFPTGTVAGEWEIAQTLCKGFTRAIKLFVEEVDPLQLADEASRAFTLQAEEATREMQKQADEADTALRASVSPFWDNPDGYSEGAKQ